MYAALVFRPYVIRALHARLIIKAMFDYDDGIGNSSNVNTVDKSLCIPELLTSAEVTRNSKLSRGGALSGYAKLPRCCRTVLSL